MERLPGCKTSQANAHTESSSNLQLARRIYHVLPASHSRNDIYCARPASVSHMHAQSIMHSNDCSTMTDDAHTRATTSLTSKWSAPGKSSLRPLQLNSPQLSHRECFSPASIPRSPFGSSVKKSDNPPSILERRAKNSFVPPHVIKRPENYRDTPIYTERGLPLLSPAYYTEEDICFSCSVQGLSCEGTCIIHDYDHSGDDSSEGGDWFDILPDIFGEKSELSTLAKRPSQDSELSFTCRGESGFGTTLFHDEAAWLSSSSPPRPHSSFSYPDLKVMPPEHEIEGWLDDASSCDGDDEVFACATVLAPLRAQVVDVSHSSRITVDIPPRSSSFAGARPRPLTPDGGRKSRMSFRSSVYSPRDSYFSDSWSVDDNEASRQLPFPTSSALPGSQFDLARTSPPLSPKRQSGWQRSPDPPMPARIQSATNSHRFTGFHAYPDDPSKKSRIDSDNALHILSALEDSTSNFPATMLLPDTSCISAIRSRLRHSPTNIPPIPNIATLSSNGLSNNSLPNTTRRTTSCVPTHRRHSSVSITDHPLPLQSSPVRLSRSPIFQQPIPCYPRSLDSSAKTLLPHPNLLPLQTILPKASTFLLGALYAHILAYNFLLAQLTRQLSPTQPSCTPPKPAHLHNIPFYTTTSHALPSKLPKVLGEPGEAALPKFHKVDARHNAVVVQMSDDGQARAEHLRERVRTCVSWLVGEIEVRDGESVESDINGVLLRALGEVVRGCEESDGAVFGFW